MLGACHDRVERVLGLLERLAAHLRDHGADTPARQAALDVMRYFDQAAPAHHEDEERHVFPVIARGPDLELAALVERLQAEHRELTRQWAALRLDLQRVSEGVPGALLDPAATQRWQVFAALNRRHVSDEEKLAYPAVRPRLDDVQLRMMGEAMARRRGLR